MYTISARPAALAAATAVILLAGCASLPAGSAPPSPPGEAPTPTAAAQATEVSAPRIAATVPGGIAVLDAATLETVETIDLEGFLRLNTAGDERSIVVTAPGGFRLLDTGVEIERHGDHDHFHAVPPTLGDTIFHAEHPGHVTVHAGTTTLFDDATGRILTTPSAQLLDDSPQRREHSTPDAHHGVALTLEDGSLVTTLGTEAERTSVIASSPDGETTVRTDSCPGVHGETVAADETVVFGCQNGAVILRDGTFTHVPAPDAYGRIGTIRGHHDSAVVLGDYKVDADAELERPTRVSLLNTETGTLQLVDLGTSYSFRSLARGPHGEALVLGTDGAIAVIDPDTGAVTERIPAVDPWEEPLDWQQPRPTLMVSGHTYYVTDPANDRVIAMEGHSGEVLAQATLPGTPNEIAATH